MIELLVILVVLVLAYYVGGFDVFLRERRHPPDSFPNERPVVGKTATVSEGFDKQGTILSREGRVEFEGSVWLAETDDERDSLTVGDRVTVVGRDGLRLLVEKAE